MSLAIIIINYRTPAITIDCVASLAPQIEEVSGTRVMLIDNASGDDSVSELECAIAERGWSRWVELIPLESNRGFAGGNNYAIDLICRRQTPADQAVTQVLLLNSDTIAQPGVLRDVYAKMSADKSVGVMSCLLLNGDKTVQNTARKFPTPARLACYSLGLPWAMPALFSWANLDDPDWDRRGTARDVDWIGGAFMLIRRELIEQIGGMDARFFFYGEDAEYCHRARRHGWKVRYDPASAVIHLGGASSDPAHLASRQRNAMMWKARYLLQRVCYGVAAEALIRVVDITSFGLRYLKLFIVGRRKSEEFAVQRQVLSILLRWPRAASPAGRG